MAQRRRDTAHLGVGLGVHDAGEAVAGIAADAAAGLRIALVEEPVRYTGANEIADHRAVVRLMVGSPDGIPLAGGTASHSASVDLGALTASLKGYLDDFEQKPPERFRALTDSRFKEKKHALDAGNLALVAFVQDEATKEVLQASYLRLGGAAPAPANGSR